MNVIESRICARCGATTFDWRTDGGEDFCESCADHLVQSISAAVSTRHYHLEDYPDTLKVLSAVAAGRDLSAIGYETDEHGAEVSWDLLASSWLSDTEKAAVHIARGVALAERAGGLPPHVTPAVLDALAWMCGWVVGDTEAGA